MFNYNHIFFNRILLDGIVFLCNNIAVMSKIRESILKQMKKRNMTIYQVSKLVKGKVPQRTVYAYLAGEKDTGSETACILMETLGLTIVEKNNVKRGKCPRKEK